MAAADESVDELLDEGLSGSDILVLTTGEEHPWAQHERSFGEDAYWRQLGEAEDVFYAHTAHVGVAGNRSMVVLAVNGGSDSEVARALPVALEKAGTRLVVCGDQERLRTLL
ncbi:hypothetical protein [Streptomyces oceani]|uniref:Uncharacterized protein n=1 Tax=Streptomyces oceani TaxID=1075402 RepID=A0A1E7KKV0_9ACTN|nr:hypothetical protein AN216_07040 [Streptomyces oceani]